MNKHGWTFLTFAVIIYLSAYWFSFIINPYKSQYKEDSFNPVFDPTLHLYTVHSKPILWLFWDHNPMPPYIQLSLETIKCHSYNEIHLELVNAELAKRLITDAAEEVSWLIPAHQADYFRSSILLKYGGMYMDADTIQTGSVRHLYDKMENFDVYGCTWSPENASISITNVGPMRAGNLLLETWKPLTDKFLTRQHDSLKLHAENSSYFSYPLRWGDIIQIWVPIMNKLLAKNQINYTYVDGVETYGQLVMQMLPDLFEPITDETEDLLRYVNFSVEYLYYHNSGLSEELKHSQMDEFLDENLLFTAIIRKAISQCKAWQRGLYNSELIQKLNMSEFGHLRYHRTSDKW